MDRKLILPFASLLAFLLLGGVWSGVLRALPEEGPRSAVALLLGLAVVAAYLALLVDHIRHVLKGERFALHGLLVVAELAVLLAGFASVYRALGIIDATRPGSPVVHDFWLGAYLSVMTFTTVGYGDLYPDASGRALAALQGLSGYLVLGILASTAASVLSPYSPAGPSTEEKERERGERVNG